MLPTGKKQMNPNSLANLRPRPFPKGNPYARLGGLKSRPPISMSRLLQEQLHEKVKYIDKNGCEKEIRKADIIVERLIKKAAQGDLRAIDMTFERNDGKVMEVTLANRLIETAALNEEEVRKQLAHMKTEELQKEVVAVEEGPIQEGANE